MKRIIFSIMAILVLSGCSELRIIGQAAVRELKAEAINVEWSAYNQQQELAELQLKKNTMLAKADTTSKGRKAVIPSYGQRWAQTAQLQQGKGLWERH